ncbi:MAG: hypothetical protein AAF388_26645, partial [Bacteroidota bacterium]
SNVQSQNQFIDRVLNDFRNQSYYLSLKIESPEVSGKMIIQNLEFYYFLSQNRGVTRENYYETVKNLLSLGSIKLRERDLGKWGFMKVIPSSKIDYFAAKGKEIFVKQFFDGRVILNGITSNEEAAIISRLFEWKVLTHIDDESGYLIITQ